MRDYLLRRILQLIPVFLVIVFLIFLILQAAPGGPTSMMQDPHMTPAAKAELAEKFGENKPLYSKFFSWLGEAAKGDFGYSISYKKPVQGVIGQYMGSTLWLTGISLLISLLIGIPTGVICATHRGRWLDHLLTVIAFIGICIPAFFFGLLLLKFFAVDTHIFPMFGMHSSTLTKAPGLVRFGDMLWHLVLPCLVLGLGGAATFMRYTRSSMLEVLQMDFVRTARAKGLSERVVIYKHAFRNGIIPIITLLGLYIPGLFSGAVMTESVFGLPGVGKMAVDASMSRDYPLIIGITAFLSLLTLFAALLADILYAAADPRIRYD